MSDVDGGLTSDDNSSGYDTDEAPNLHSLRRKAKKKQPIVNHDRSRTPKLDPNPDPCAHSHCHPQLNPSPHPKFNPQLIVSLDRISFSLKPNGVQTILMTVKMQPAEGANIEALMAQSKLFKVTGQLVVCEAPASPLSPPWTG